MKPANFTFRSVHVRRAPGFADGGFKVNALSPGVNVVYGPNASGKTTLGRAIRRLLWPQAEAGSADEIRATSLVGELLCDEDRRVIEFDAGHVRHQCDGVESDPLLLAPLESRDRYLLALHELLSDENGSFAEQIARESAGGYDIRGAAEALGFKTVSPRAGNATTLVRQLRTQLRQASESQQALQQRAETLSELERRRDEAAAAVQFRELIGHAQRYMAARARMSAAERQLAEFPERISRLQGDESKRLEQFRERMAGEARREREAQLASDAARARLNECGLGEKGLEAGTLARLRLLAGELESIERELGQQRVELARAQAACDTARRWLGAEATDEQLAALDPPALEELLAQARRVEEHRARRGAAEAERARLAPTGETADPERLAEGMRYLHRWLTNAERSSTDPQQLRWLATAGGATLLLMSLVVAAVHHMGWLLMVPLGGACVVLAWLLGRKTGNATDDGQQDYKRLGLDGPPDWTLDEVRTHAADIARRYARANLEVERANRRREFEAHIAKLDQEQQSLNAARTQLVSRLGTAPEEEVSACLWADHLLRWQQAQVEVRTRAHAIGHLDERRATQLEELAAALSPFRYAATDRASVMAAIEDLAGRQERFQQAANHWNEAKATAAGSRRAVEALDAERSEWLTELGFGVHEEPQIRELILRHADFVAARDELRKAEVEVQVADAALASAPDLKEQSPQELAAALARATDAAEEARQLSEAIGKIRQEVESAKQKSDVEELLAREEQSCEALRELRASAGRAVVGDLLATHVSRQSRERDRPVVFRRARELFARITHGRYQLELDDSEPPCFRAIDTSTGLGHALDELSSGTRLQLLLAVRMAFVESQEQGPKLPLLLDETLGNSDERRAAEIIDAALEICRDGRQLFYFTAQHDEVRKWREVLAANEDVPHAVIDLAECRGFSEAERLGRLEPVPAMALDIPSPDGLDHAEYGRILGVPAVDVQRPVGAVHVWYVCDDAQTVHDLLRLGINNWGQLSTLCRVTGLRPIAGFDLARSEATARALDRIAEMRRVGRGRPVDRAALLASNAVTKQFIDEVAALSEQLAGDARAIIEALDKKAVKNFRTNALSSLRDYLVSEGHLDEREPHSSDEIRLDTLAVVMEDVNAGHLAVERIDQLLAFTEPAAKPPSANGKGADLDSKAGRVAVDSAIGDSLF